MKTFTKIGAIGEASHHMGTEELHTLFFDTVNDIRDEIASPGPSTQSPEETMWRVNTVSRLDDILGRIERSMTHYADSSPIEYEPGEYGHTQDCLDNLNTLTNLLEEFTPDCSYFGQYEQDGPYGYWVDWERIQDEERCGQLIRLDAGDEWPEDEIQERVEAECLSYLLETTDHGNCTLYGFNQYPDGRVEHFEIWSVV